jgi:hypothetical protein
MTNVSVTGSGEMVVGKGMLTLTDSVKRELYNEETIDNRQ